MAHMLLTLQGRRRIYRDLYSPAQSFKHAKQVKKTTGQPWRVPNLKEWISLLQPGHNPEASSIFSFAGELLTSTPFAWSPSYSQYFLVNISINGVPDNMAYPTHGGATPLVLVK